MLDLHPVAIVQRRKTPPWAMDGRQRIRLVTALLDQPSYQFPDILGAFPRCHHDRVGGSNDDEVLDADHRDEPCLEPQIAIASLFGYAVALDRIALAVLPAHLPQAVPGDNIAPPHDY